MSKYKLGDKVRTIKDRDCKIGIITDIDEDASFPYQVRVGDDDNYYYSEDMLEPYIEKTYDDGLRDAWELVRKIYEMPKADLYTIFNTEKCLIIDILTDFTPQQALDKIAEYESHQIKVDDEVVHEDGAYGVVTSFTDGRAHVLWEDGTVTTESCMDKLRKTGKKLGVTSLLTQLGEN